jgi:predicted RNA-binding Zn ribbon-like protein
LNIITEHEFEFIGGNLCLDFVNTWGGLPADSITQDRLTNYAALLAWAYQAKLISENEALLLIERADNSQSAASATLERALNLREAMREIFLALAKGEKPNESDFDLLNRELEQGMAGARLMPAGDVFVLQWPGKSGTLEQMLAPVVRSAATLLTSAELPLLRKCANPMCRWLFVDSTKNHRRQWCKTSGCGNVMRVRKHRERQRDKGES